MLHIHNGDCSAEIAKTALLPGEHLTWRESLITGPTPAALSGDEWILVRARHLSEAYGEDLQKCEEGLSLQETALASFSEHDEVVLWFEHDLFCQLHLIYLLDWFSRHDLAETRLSLICVGQFPGKENFRGLGELSSEELASLFPARTEVSGAQLSLAASAWQACCFPDPTAIEKLLHHDTSSLPFLGAALQAHLQRFPSTANGLGRIENRALELIQQGLNGFIKLFAKFSDAEAIYGFGDSQLWLTLRRLNAANQPLLTITGTGAALDQIGLTPGIAQEAQFKLTELGEAVLNGKADFVDLNGIELWLGGAYLYDGEGYWRWNEDSCALEFFQH